MITIITIAYNEEENIERTIKSVLSQDFTDYEYIIKDGGSSDGTAEKAESYRELFERKGVAYKVISSKDKGIYDAMNIAVSEARGDWTAFMNAGDEYFSDHVFKGIFANNDWRGTDLIYGDTAEEEYGELHYFRKCPELIEKRMPFSHQSVFARTELLRQFPFDLKWRIGADYDFLLKCHKAGKKFADSGVLVAKISKTGVSSLKLKDTYLETIAIKRERGVEIPDEKEMKKELISISIRQFGMDNFPDFLKYWIRKVQRKMRKQKRVQRSSESKWE